MRVDPIRKVVCKPGTHTAFLEYAARRPLECNLRTMPQAIVQKTSRIMLMRRKVRESPTR